MIKKIAVALLVAFIALYIVKTPIHAAHSGSGILDWLSHAGNSLGRFLSHLR